MTVNPSDARPEQRSGAGPQNNRRPPSPGYPQPPPPSPRPPAHPRSPHARQHNPPRWTPEYDARSATTRYLAAATELERDFCDLVVDRIVYQPYRALAPSFGTDVTVVARYALRARSRRIARDILLAGILLATVVLFVLLLPDGRAGDVGMFPWPVPVAGVLAAWVVLVAERWHSSYLVLERHLSRSRFQPDVAPQPYRQGIHRRLNYLQRNQNGNLVVFSEYAPFVGGGIQLDSVSFAIDVGKGMHAGGAEGGHAGRLRPKEFSTEGLERALADALYDMRLPRTRVERKLFVSGLDASRFRNLVPDGTHPPIAGIQPAVLDGLARDYPEIARSYVVVETGGWGGQLVVSTYIRAVRFRGSLFLEIVSYVLPPLQSWCLRVDQLAGRGLPSSVMDALGAATQSLPQAFLGSPAAVVRTVAQVYRWRRRVNEQRKVVEDASESLPFDYGALPSIRVELAGNTYRRYFLELDADMYTKVVFERASKFILDFLRAHDVDIGEIQQVVNNHIFNNTGTITGSAINQGEGNRASVGGQPSRSAQGRQGSGGGSPPGGGR